MYFYLKDNSVLHNNGIFIQDEIIIASFQRKSELAKYKDPLPYVNLK